MLTPALTITPFGKRIGSRMSQGMLACSLQWIKVSSRSKMSVGFCAGGNFLGMGQGGMGLFAFLMKFKISKEAIR